MEKKSESLIVICAWHKPKKIMVGWKSVEKSAVPAW